MRTPPRPLPPSIAGQYVKAADDGICAHLKAAGRLVSKGSLTHSYPFCWRSEVSVRVWVFWGIPCLRSYMLTRNS